MIEKTNSPSGIYILSYFVKICLNNSDLIAKLKKKIGVNEYE